MSLRAIAEVNARDQKHGIAQLVFLRDWRGVLFVEFCAELRIRLTPGQLAFALVAFDGLEPRDLPSTLRSCAREIFGPLDVIPPEVRRVVVIVAGARCGKTYVFSALRALHLALSLRDLSVLAPGERAYGAIVAPNPEQRAQCFAFVRGAVEHSALAGHLVGKVERNHLVLRRADGHEVEIVSVPAKMSGGSLRSRWHTSVSLEEAAFFRDAGYVVNDRDLFDAAFPRVLPGGQLIVPSTPWAQSGLLYEEFMRNHPEPWRADSDITQAGAPTTALAAHAPTLFMRDTELNRAIVRMQTRRDERNARREYGAQFLPIGAMQFFDVGALSRCIDASCASSSSGSTQALFAEGIDLGFVHDAAAGVVVERNPEGYWVRAEREIFAAAEKLKPSQVIHQLFELGDPYGCEEYVGDQHYAETAKEQLYEARSPQRSRNAVWIGTASGAGGKAEMFVALRIAISELMVHLPPDSSLIQQLREVRCRALPGGGLAIEQPRKPLGGHGDKAAALAAAVWRLALLQLPAAPEQLPADPVEREALLWVRELEQRRSAQELAEQRERERERMYLERRTWFEKNNRLDLERR